MKFFKFIIIFSLFVWNFASAKTIPTWMAAHRVNSNGSLQAAINAKGINGIESDVCYSKKINMWITDHADFGCDKYLTRFKAKDLVSKVKSGNNKLSLVWFDIKSQDLSCSVYDKLFDLGKSLTSKNINVMFGVSNISKNAFGCLAKNLSSAERKNKYGKMAIDLWIKNRSSLKKLSRICKNYGINCTVSTGNAFLGEPLSNPIKSSRFINRIIDAREFPNITKSALWTFNNVGAVEDDILRLGLKKRDYWEYLFMLDWHCGAEADIFLVGRAAQQFDKYTCLSPRGKEYYMCKEIRTTRNLAIRSDDIGDREGYHAKYAYKSCKP